MSNECHCLSSPTISIYLPLASFFCSEYLSYFYEVILWCGPLNLIRLNWQNVMLFTRERAVLILMLQRVVVMQKSHHWTIYWGPVMAKTLNFSLNKYKNLSKFHGIFWKGGHRNVRGEVGWMWRERYPLDMTKQQQHMWTQDICYHGHKFGPISMP